jgi:hypothetical protein
MAEIQDASLKKLSPGERKMYENLRLSKQSTKARDFFPKKGSSNHPSRSASPANVSRSLEAQNRASSSFLTRGVQLSSVASDTVDDDDTSHTNDALLKEQYDLTNKFFHHQRSQLKISDKIARQNLSLQEQQTEKTIRDTVQRQSSPSKNRQKPLGEQEQEITSDIERKLQRLMSTSPDQKVTSSSKKPAANSQDSSAQSTLTNASNVTGVSDWVECFDPRSSRKYYYSAAMKKSTWVKPAELSGNVNGSQLPVEEASAHSELASSGRNARSQSPMNFRMLSEESGTGISYPHQSCPDHAYTLLLSGWYVAEPTRRQLTRSAPMRDASPSGPMRNWGDISGISADALKAPLNRSSQPSPAVHSTASSRDPSAASASSRRSHPSSTQSVWAAAVDPKTQRKYWYNRKTKVSTWRKPFDLI